MKKQMRSKQTSASVAEVAATFLQMDDEESTK